jgi:hypothetical protein
MCDIISFEKYVCIYQRSYHVKSRAQATLQHLMAQSDPTVQARLNYIFREQRPAPEVVQLLLTNQRLDGGWSPFWTMDYSSLDATCYRLAKAEQMGYTAPDEPALQRALQLFVQRQQPDGSLEEESSKADAAPNWAKPGNQAAGLYLTANCGYWLSSWDQTISPAQRAAAYIWQFLDEQGHLPSFLHTHWLAAGLWYRLGQHEEAERVINYLDSRLSDISASGLAWLVCCLRAVGVPLLSNQCLRKAILLLEKQQQPDGLWKSEDGPSEDINATLEAIRALCLYGKL